MKKTKYRLSYSSKFGRDYRKLVRGNRRLAKRVVKAVGQLCADPFYPGLKTHTVNIPKTGKFYTSRITGDLRILWTLKEDNIIFLYRIGGHSGGLNVYK